MTMNPRVIINGVGNRTLIKALKALSSGATGLDMAVSYVRQSGWAYIDDLIRRSNLTYGAVRVLLTDQMWVTEPLALRRPLGKGVLIWRHNGQRIYHPKVYMFYRQNRSPRAAVISSGNISKSGLDVGLEASVIVTSRRQLVHLKNWFDATVQDPEQARLLDEEQRESWERKWRSRKKVELTAWRGRRRGLGPRGKPLPEDLDVLEGIFCGLSSPIAVLGIDHAGNNVRNLDHLLTVLRRPVGRIVGKQRSELRLLGLFAHRRFSGVGKRAARCKTARSLARCWCKWVAQEAEVNLRSINPSIVSFKIAATRFWRLQPDVRRFFLSRSRARGRRRILQCIELLCNTSDLACGLSLENVQHLCSAITQGEFLAPFAKGQLTDYLLNKGARSWVAGDRRVILQEWRKVTM